MKYPIIPIESFDKIEQLGSKQKFWFYDPNDNTQKLFKIGRPGTGENWAEKVAFEIAKLLGLPCAKYDFGVWHDKEGVVSPIFVPDHGRLIHGNELLAKVIENYPERVMYKVRQYNLSTVIALIQLIKDSVRVPIGFSVNEHIGNPLDVFIGYLMFDCLISNGDRHHENWGLIYDTENKCFHLAPTYDHASGLGCRVSDEEMVERIRTKDERYKVKAFVERGKSAFYGKDKKLIPNIYAFIYAARQNYDAANYWLDRLELLSLRGIVEILARVPSHLIGKNTIDFVVEVLDANRNRLLALRGDMKNG